MRVVLAPAAFEGWLNAGQAAAAMAAGWLDQAPGDDLRLCPLSDGGPGFVAVVSAALGGELLPRTVRGPLGEPVPATVALVDGPVPTAYVEAAQAVGLHLVRPEHRDVGAASSYGVGELVQAAVDTGARKVVVGVGGTGTNDGGAGLLAALGGGPQGALARGGLALAEVRADDLTGLGTVRSRLADVELVLASATDVPLLGLHGTSATYAEGKGASPEQAQRLESALGHFADLASRSVLVGRPLLGAGPSRQPGSGAGGGVGFALLLLGASRVDGVRQVIALTDLDRAVAQADLVVTGQRVFDWESLRGGVVAEVSAVGLAAGVPVVVVAAQVLVGRREAMTLGLAGTYPVAEHPEQLDAASAEGYDGAAALRARTARVARTWSPTTRPA